MGARSFDALIVGTGQAGKPLAAELADHGLRVAIVEKSRVGGTCIIDGCTPTKTMIASARVARLARRSSDFGVETGQVFIRMSDVRARKRAVVDDFSSSSRRALEDHDGIELLYGRARFVDDHTLVVESVDGSGDTETVTAERVFLDVGGRPRIPDIEGLESVEHLTSTSILELGEVPRHLAVLGGGPVGVEFAQMFARFGAGVTVIEQGSRLLLREDPDVSAALQDIFDDEGITVLTDSETTRVDGTEGGGVRLAIETPEGPAELVASHLLVAAGRVPNSDLLDPDNAGLVTDAQGYIEVDDRCRTGVEGIWALGDVTGAPPFTHIAFDDYRVVAADVLEDEPSRTRSRRLVPYCVYTDPELGRVGLSETQAEERGMDVKVARLPMSSAARAIEMDETRGFMKCLVDAGSDRIVGVTVLGVHGGEIMSVLQTAMMGDLPYTAIRDGIYAHPTLAESLQNLFAALDD